MTRRKLLLAVLIFISAALAPALPGKGPLEVTYYYLPG